MAILTKVETHHAELENADWDYHRVWFTDEKVYRDAIGRRGSGTTTFLVVGCINIDCGFRALVRQVDLEDAVAEAIKENHG